METLSRRFNSTFGTLTGLKHTLKHGKSLTNIMGSNGFSGSQQDMEEQVSKMEGLEAPQLGHSRTASAASAQGSLGSETSRSISMNSISSEGSSELPLVEQEDIIALTHNVRSFKEALGRLRRIFHPDRDKQDSVRVAAHERLGEVLRILRAILEKYAPLQSTELLMAAGQLIQQVKGYHFEDVKVDTTEFFESIDQLALAFSSRVSEYLMGDLDTSSTIHPAARTRSCENLCGDGDMDESKTLEVLSPQQLDERLMKLEQGVSIALLRAKVWAKYAKDVLTYIEKRANYEAEYARNLAKLAHTMRPLIKEDSYLPFQSIYCAALDQDADNATLCQATCSLLLGHKFVEPLTTRKNEHERARKQIKDMWQREMKKMHDAVNHMAKARSMYYQRQQDYEKARDALMRAENGEGTEASKVDKKKRLEDDALQKAIDAETTYKACVVEANERHQILHKVKGEILKQVRELILQCDQTMKAVTVGYFQLQHTVSAPAPVQFQTLCESSRLYEPGLQYMEYIKHLSLPLNTPATEPPPYEFQLYNASEMRLQDKDRRELDGSDEYIGHMCISSRLSDSSKGSKAHGVQPMKAWGQAGSGITGSDSDSVASNQSNKSLDTSPYSSPQIATRHSQQPICNDESELDPDTGIDNGEFPPRGLSKAAVTHTFRKLKTPSRCRECDSYVYFQGIECIECGLGCHKKCVDTLAIQCGHKRLPPKLTTFGVDLSAYVQETQTEVPHLVRKCIREMDTRGMYIKGIYRVSGVKSKVEKLCQSFENGADLVDLSEVHPNVVANVLKLYLRQLPEPLLTFRLYPEFVNLAKKYPPKDNVSKEVLLDELRTLVLNLPLPHYWTLAALMLHLKRVADGVEVNNMPASNLGIVFGPTLLRTSEGTASLSSLVDTVHQTRAIELLITFSQELFGDGYDGLLAQTKISVKQASVGITRAVQEKMLIYTGEANRSISKATAEQFRLPGCLGSSQDVETLTDDVLNSSEDYAVALNSDDELPDSLLPDDSVSNQSPLLNHRHLHLRRSSNNKPHDPSVAPFLLRKCLSDGGQVHLHPKGELETPVPPPRRHSNQPRQCRVSPMTSKRNSPSMDPDTATADRIVIHVQSVCNAESADDEKLRRNAGHRVSASESSGDAMLNGSLRPENYQPTESWSSGNLETAELSRASTKSLRHSDNVTTKNSETNSCGSMTECTEVISVSQCNGWYSSECQSSAVPLTNSKGMPMPVPSPRFSRMASSSSESVNSFHSASTNLNTSKSMEE